MKTIISSAIFLLFFTHDFRGQNMQITLKPSLKEDQVKNYSITYSVRSSADGTEQTMSTTKKQVKIKVVAIHDDFIEMQWQYDKIEFTEANSQNNPFTVLMNTLSAGITVKYLRGSLITRFLRSEFSIRFFFASFLQFLLMADSSSEVLPLGEASLAPIGATTPLIDIP